MPAPYEPRSKAKLTATLATIIVVAGVVIFVDHLKSKSSGATTTAAGTSEVATATNSRPTSSTSTESTASTATSAYKDGTYMASENYFVPSGYEQLKVTLTLNKGVVSSSSIANSEGDPDSAAFQEDFASMYKTYVVGKQITGLRLGVIAGASDTTDAFDRAVSQIASQAQA